MKIELWKYRVNTPIETFEQAKEIAKDLSGGDLGIITITFESKEERKEFRETHKIRNEGEWRFITKTSKPVGISPSSLSS